jgi:hypothetical protein
LRETTSRSLFQKIRDDTSTVREQATIRDTEQASARDQVPDAPATIGNQDTHPTPPIIRYDSFGRDEVSSIGFNAVPPDLHESRDLSWQRPQPFEMLPYDSAPSSPVSDRSSATSGLFSRVVSSSNTLYSTDSHLKSPSSLSRRFSRLRLLTSGSSARIEEAPSPKSQISIKSPGPLAATDMYLQSENNRPPPKTIVAAQRGDHFEMAALIRHRVNIEQPHSSTGRTPLAVASHCGHDEVVELLISEGANCKLGTVNYFRHCISPRQMAIVR